MSDVGPFDFLFCQECDKHVGNNFFLGDYNVAIDKTKMSDTDRMKRVAPVVQVKAKVKCGFCAGPLIQKYISVVVTIPKGEENEKDSTEES